MWFLGLVLGTKGMEIFGSTTNDETWIQKITQLSSEREMG
jgi:hypothetical protein